MSLASIELSFGHVIHQSHTECQILLWGSSYKMNQDQCLGEKSPSPVPEIDIFGPGRLSIVPQSYSAIPFFFPAEEVTCMKLLAMGNNYRAPKDDDCLLFICQSCSFSQLLEVAFHCLCTAGASLNM